MGKVFYVKDEATKTLAAKFKQLRAEGTPSATATALNAAGSATRRELVTVVKTALQIPPTPFSKRIKTNRASRKQLMFTLRILEAAIMATELGKARQTRTGVTVGRKSFPRAFLTAPSFNKGNVQVFKRKSKDRYPIGPPAKFEHMPIVHAQIRSIIDSVGYRAFVASWERRMLREARKHGAR